MTGTGGTLTVSDVEKWNPDALTTASDAVGKLSGDLDQAVLAAVDSTQRLGHEQSWGGGAAQVADARMQLEKTRASVVSQAVLGLQTALTQQVANLIHTKSEVARLKNIAETPPAPNVPAFKVNDDGSVSAADRIAWLRQNRKDSQGNDLFTEDKLNEQILQENIDALNQQVGIQRALAQALSVATSATTALNLAEAQMDTAFTGLGDPVTGAGAAAPAPAVPVATTPQSAAPAPSHSGSPVSQAMGTPHHGSGDSSGGYSSAAYSGGGTSGPPPTAHPSGDVKQWIAQAKQVLIDMGYPPESIDENAIALIIEHESGGDPNAINNWDSNAAAGHPSKGLMQCIDSTFSAHAAPGHTDIWNPVDNIVAATRYSIDRYGSLDSVPGVSAVSGGSGYVGY
ncbi:transglycosylase SLT domain-containing protein [Nocardia sp. NPDC052254]|uniref:lytic transglycosylase domain-containing protein n=1 Tax=Nocardia sp. NPDC052254 TaxID=3155681 RepID=UPI0034411488